MKRVVRSSKPYVSERSTTIPTRVSQRLSSDGAEGSHYILGGGPVAIAIAEELQAAGHSVVVVDEAYESGSIPVFSGDPAAKAVLTESGLDDRATVVVASRSDHRNLLIAQLVRTGFDVQDVVVFVHDPDRAPIFADAGHKPFCVTSAVAAGFGETI